MQTNNNVAVQQVTGFYAGRIYGDLGAFVQVSADPVNKVLWFDGSDVRYTKTFQLFGKDTVFGVDVNNTPDVPGRVEHGQRLGFPPTQLRLLRQRRAGDANRQSCADGRRRRRLYLVEQSALR